MPLDSEPFRRRLADEIAHIDETLEQTRADADTVEADQSSIGRLSRMDALQRQAMAQGMRERLATRKRKLQAALDRIEAGTFGRCCQCEAEIDTERLDTDPAAVFCLTCMRERDSEHGEHPPRQH